jgi:hypothetical protein
MRKVVASSVKDPEPRHNAEEQAYPLLRRSRLGWCPAPVRFTRLWILWRSASHRSLWRLSRSVAVIRAGATLPDRHNAVTARPLCRLAGLFFINGYGNRVEAYSYRITRQNSTHMQATLMVGNYTTFPRIPTIKVAANPTNTRSAGVRAGQRWASVVFTCALVSCERASDA